MGVKVVVVLALVLTALCLSDGEYARRRRLSRLSTPGSGLHARPRLLCLRPRCPERTQFALLCIGQRSPFRRARALVVRRLDPHAQRHGTEALLPTAGLRLWGDRATARPTAGCTERSGRIAELGGRAKSAFQLGTRAGGGEGRVPGPCGPAPQLAPARSLLDFQSRIGSEAVLLRTVLEVGSSVGVGESSFAKPDLHRGVLALAV